MIAHTELSTSSDSSYCRFGSEALLKLLQTIEAQMDGVEKSEDIEYVHKMRVTSRRIRAAMPIFKECFPKKSYKKWIDEIKKVTQFLGTARDLDVQIAFIKEYMKQLQPSEPKTGIENLLGSYVDQRTNVQSNVISGLQELEESKVLQQITSYCKQVVNESISTSFNLYWVREKAFWHISSKLDDFLSMEDCVHKENEVLKHHEMRIKAKWLRYTMEAFALLYPGELSEEIETIKNFQDTLGEMHDCDVWIECIPKFINEIENEIATFSDESANDESNQDLTKFLDSIKQRRKKHYQNFAILWDEKKSKNFFENLRKTASAGFVAARYRMQAELANPYVKIAIVSNIHANLNALDAVIQDAERRGVTVFINAGNSVGYGAFPNEVIHTLYSKNTLSVIGNYDLEVLDTNTIGKGPEKFALEYPRKALVKPFETYLRAFPIKLELEVAHKKLLIVHGTLDKVDEFFNHDTPEERFEEIAKKAGAEIIVLGHSEEQFTKKAGGALFINPGSVGKSIDGIPKASYAVITSSPFSVELLRVSYDVEAAADALRKKGAPESYSQMLLRGMPLEDVLAEDKTREKEMDEKYTQIIKITQEVAEKYWPDVEHSGQVKKLALELFDSLQDLHMLGIKERYWLECAAILHDIGLSQGSKGHHKNSLKLILNDLQLQFTSTDRRVIGNVTRYHRKEIPKNNHYMFTSLSRELKRKTSMLAGILRLADGLDFSHQSIVQTIESRVALDNVIIQGLAIQNPILEDAAVNKKKDLFEKTFKKKVAITWKQPQQPQQQLSQSTETTEAKTNSAISQNAISSPEPNEKAPPNAS